jgi:phosphoglycolate phosphatase
MPFRAAIFDLDGTLADTLETIAGVANFALRSLGLPEHAIADYRAMVGEGISVLCRKALPPDRADLQPELLARARARYATHYLDRARLYPGMRELLEELAGRGAKLAVLSNKPDELAVKTVEGLGVAQCFARVVGQRDGVPPKPDATSARLVQKALGVDANEVLYVGDSAIDMETAKRASFASIGVLWGFRGRQELLDAGARWLVEEPGEILPIYRGTRTDGRERR